MIRFFQGEGADLLRPVDLQVRGDGATWSGSHADHPPHGPRELWMGGGAQFVGNEHSYLKKDARRSCRRLPGFNWTWRRKLWGWLVWISTRFPAGADEGLQAVAIADSSEGPRREPVETVRLEKCFGDVQGTDPCSAKRRCCTRRTTTIWESIRVCRAIRSTTARMIMRRVAASCWN